MPKQLIVQFTPLRSCLVNLPSQWVNALLDQRKVPQNVILELTWTPKESSSEKKTYCGWSGQASKPLPPNSVFLHGQNSKLDVLEMDPQLGLAVGLTEGQKVNVEFCRNVPDCSSVHVEPYSEDDWEILELHAGYVEENLLSQLRAVYNNQTFCVWIYGQTLVRLRVAELSPSAPVIKLTTNSEVIVAPKVRKLAKTPAETAATVMKQQKTAANICLRSLPLSSVENLDINGLAPVVIHPDSASIVSGSKYVRISKIVPSFAKQKDTEDNAATKDGNGNDLLDEITPAKAIYAPLILSTSVPTNHVLLNESIRLTLAIKDFDIVKIATATNKKSSIGSLILRRYVAQSNTNPSSLKLGLDASAQKEAQLKAQRDAEAVDAFKEFLSLGNQEEIVITQGTMTLLGEDKVCVLVQFGQKKGLFSALNGVPNSPLIPQDTEQYTILHHSQLKNLHVQMGEDLPKLIQDEAPKKKLTKESSVMGGVQKIFEKIHQYILVSLAQQELRHALAVPESGSILITGAHGAGKTSLVNKLINALHNDPAALIYTREINCAEVADERIPTFKDMLQRWFDEAAWHAPSLIFFDDLDRLIPAEVEHADSTRSRHLAELFLRTAMTMTRRHPIIIIATAQQQQSIHPSLISNHIFTELKHLNPPSRDERKEIMETIMAHGPSVLSESLPRIDLVSVASETEGYLAADLKALIERAVHEGAVRSIKENKENNEGEGAKSLQLIQQDFTKAREGFVPSSLRGVKLQSSGVQWSDIGGLNETRRALLETLEWPTKYAAIFSQSPLRLRSGLLLYGYPGCGKTLLASAVAKECGLNFISVKGPEILNKYIGASEKSVRDLFERAQAAKPCVLFFDEFDSIAPRRGHDSTGVTDRVVNQMLTQMDGAEGLDGVYVLAATSRPDLIDPALLRPGRLDKALLCGMPNLEERLEILEALSRKMTLAEDVDLKVFAERTEGFSGADLQGFLYNAHLEAIHGAVNIESFKEQQKRDQEVKQKDEDLSEYVLVRSTANSSGKRMAPPLTLAEKGQISQRLSLIKKGLTYSNNKRPNKAKQVAAAAAAAAHAAAAITNAHLEKSLKGTRPSITAEEYMRLTMIYNEFVTGRTGELPSGEGAKGIGKRTTLG